MFTDYEKVFDVITLIVRSQNLVLGIISINSTLFHNDEYIYYREKVMYSNRSGHN